MSGVYRLFFNLRTSNDDGDTNYVYLYLNGDVMEASQTGANLHDSDGHVSSNGAREVIIAATKGDTITLKSNQMDGELQHVLTCFEYQPI